MEMSRNNCLICGGELIYTEHAEELECHFCHRKFMSNARCQNGHYICDECHGKEGIRQIKEYCLATKSRNPIAIAQEIMENPYIYMHGPEHHVLVGAALLTACHNCGNERDLAADLEEMINRGSQVPGGICGLWGSCGAAVSTGIFVSILTDSNPLSGHSWGQANEMTSKSLADIAAKGGPRCCKRDSFTAILAASRYVKEQFGIELETTPEEQVVCHFSKWNAQCLGRKCPYNLGNHSLTDS